MKNEGFIQSIALPGEQWRDVVGYEGRYCVSSHGRVASMITLYKQGGYQCRRSPRLLNTHTTSRGYKSVLLIPESGGRKSHMVHQLVAKAFIPNPSGLPQINHRDENPLNNHVSNLEWCTGIYNLNYGTRKEKMIRTLRESAPNKRPVVQLSPDGEYIATFPSASEAARTVGTYDSTIIRCCSGVYKTGKKFRWMYLSDYESQVSMSKNSFPNS